MSVEAITWALGQTVGHSSAKFVLVALANCADSEMRAWPSIAYLCGATEQNRKTVIENLRRLRERGLIESTGEMKGKTALVPVYRLNTETVPKAEPLGEGATVPKAGPLNSSKQDQNRDRSKPETVPKTDGNGTENGRETVPKTGHGTVSRNVKEPRAKEKQLSRGERLPLDWVPDDGLWKWAENERPDLNLRTVLESFRDYWRAQPGQRGVKLDWPATFRNWVRHTRPINGTKKTFDIDAWARSGE